MRSQMFIFEPQKDALICRWFMEIRKRYPRTASKIVLFAINHFIKNGKFVTIAKMTHTTADYFSVYEPALKRAKSLTLPHEELLDKWFQHLETMGITKTEAVRMVLTQSIQLVQKEEDEVFFNLTNIIMNANGTSALTGKFEQATDHGEKDTSITTEPISQVVMPAASVPSKSINDDKHNFMQACAEFALDFE